MPAPQNIKDYIMGHFNPEISALERFDTVVADVATDDVAVSLLEKVLNSAERYFCKVVEMETRLKIARLRMDGDELRDEIQRLDANRRFAHEALISNLHIFNRYIIKEFGGIVPIGGIFSKSPEAIHDRIAVADWAGELLSAVYNNRKR